MNPRNTGILFVVAVLVVGGVWWNENVRKSDAAEAEAEARALFPDVAPEDIEWVALETTDRRSARLERREGALRGVEPLEFAVDRTSADGILAALAEVRSEAVIEDPRELDVYGLGESGDRVRFGAGGEEHAIIVGAKTPVGSHTYATVGGGDAVYTIPSYRATALRRSFDDLREKRVLRFDAASIERVELAWRGTGGPGGVTLERGDDGWRMTAPVEDAVDEAAVDGLLSDLAFLRAEGFLDEPPPDAELGLDRPFFEARLAAAAEGDGPPRVHHLLVGDDRGGNRRVARGAEAVTFEIPSERLDDFPRTVGAYRFKQLARFVASDAKQLELAFHDAEAGAHVVIAEHGEDGWASSPEELAPGRAARIVAELATLDGIDLLADDLGPDERAALGLDPPSVTLRVRGAGSDDGPGPVLAEVWLGEVDPDLGIAARARDGERIYRIDYGLAEHLPISLEALRNRFLAKDEPPPDA